MSNQALSFIGKLDRREESMILNQHQEQALQAAAQRARQTVQGLVSAETSSECVHASYQGGLGKKRGDV